MSKASKIQKRDLDPSLVDLLLNAAQKGYIDLSDLSPELQYVINQALNSGSTGGAYNDTVLVNAVDNLRINKADKTELVDLFNKAIHKVSPGMIDEELMELILTGGVEINIDEYRRKDAPLEYTDLSITIQNKIGAIETSVAQMEETTESLNDEVVSINQQLTSLLGMAGSLSELSSIRTDLDTVKTDVDAVSSAMGNLSSQISQVNSTLAAIDAELDTVPSKNNPVTEELLAPSLAAEIDKIGTLEAAVTSMQQTNNIQVGQDGQFAVFAGELGIANCSMLYFGAITRTAIETTAAIAEVEPYIYDIGSDVLYISDTVSAEMDINIKDLVQPDTVNVGYHYLQNFISLYMYNGKFVYDENTGEMVYLGDPITTIKKPEYNTNVVINSGSSYTFVAANPYSKGLKVLVLDTDSASRTYNKYINSEAVATVAYSNTGITIYNDSAIILEFKICC
jgi:uncharacterized protein YoxC